MSFIYCHLNFHTNLLRPWHFPLSMTLLGTRFYIDTSPMIFWLLPPSIKLYLKCASLIVKDDKRGVLMRSIFELLR
jgi:hypothetical protein